MAEACAALAADRLPREVGADVLATFSALGRSAARTRRLIETLLHESRSTIVPLRREPVDLKPLVGECVAMLAPEIDARSAIVKVDDLPRVHGEPELLGGLFTNLLANALKYNPRQGGAVSVGSAQRGGDWTIFVDDEGPRIPAEDRERIFEPFHRGRGERRVKGAGLGLTICRRIVERHGGAIGIADAPTGGNRFAFTLPG
jgi:signal transduction histidine kinase